MNINKSFINTLSFSGKETTCFDDSVKGFGVCVCKSSASYILMYRNAYGRQKKLTICKTTLMTPTEARDEAKRLLALVVQGKDPEQEKLERRKVMTSLCFRSREKERTLPRTSFRFTSNQSRSLRRRKFTACGTRSRRWRRRSAFRKRLSQNCWDTSNRV